MKNRLFALVMAAMMLFMSLVLSGHALSASITPLGDQSMDAPLPSELPCDTVIQLPDPNFEAAVRRIIGKPEGDIMLGDVSGITSLSLNNLNITDLTGIEYFTALETLECNANLLTKLDISQNTMMIVLECRSNQLTKLDVSNNIALKSLNCWGNQLTSVNVSGATALEWFQCSDNQLATLDISQNTALESLYCSENQLTSLNVSNATMLLFFNCAYNRLITLDVNHNTTLKSLNCPYNRLTTLDISQNTALESLYCNFNQLTMLDVSHNTALKWLYCNDNLFPDKSAIIGLDENRLDYFVFDTKDDLGDQSEDASPLSGLPGDTAIQLPDPNFEAEVRRIIGKPEGDITANDVAEITSLRVDRLDIADLTGIEYFTALETLDCARNQLIELDLSQNTRLIRLYCEWNQLTTLNVSNNATLESLYCYNNQLKTLDVSQNTALTGLNCYNNLFPDISAIVGLDEDRLNYFIYNLQQVH